MNAASSGPSDEPALPPVWNSDCAKPWRPPDASRAMRDDSGWKTADPTPTSAAAASTSANRCADATAAAGRQREAHADASEYGFGRRSV